MRNLGKKSGSDFHPNLRVDPGQKPRPLHQVFALLLKYLTELAAHGSV